MITFKSGSQGGVVVVVCVRMHELGMHECLKVLVFFKNPESAMFLVSEKPLIELLERRLLEREREAINRGCHTFPKYFLAF